jgi:hypothetical protein
MQLADLRRHGFFRATAAPPRPLLMLKRLPDIMVNKKNNMFPPVPIWKPNIAVDLKRTEETFSYYVNGKEAFAIFSYGTCIIINKYTKKPKKDALEILNLIFCYHPDFNPYPMDDGNWIITYNHPAFSVVFKDEVENNWEYIEINHKGGLVEHEVLINPSGVVNEFDAIGKIALFGRARMFMDAQDPVIVNICRPEKLSQANSSLKQTDLVFHAGCGATAAPAQNAA